MAEVFVDSEIRFAEPKAWTTEEQIALTDGFEDWLGRYAVATNRTIHQLLTQIRDLRLTDTGYEKEG